MSKKLTIEAVEKAARDTGVDDEKRRALLELLADMTADEDTEEKPPAIKKQFAILISDPLGMLPDGHDFVGWVLQIPESENVTTTEERIANGAHLYNTTKKGRLMPVQTIGEAIENVPTKHFKEYGVWVKTRVPVFMSRTRNEIADTPSILADRGSRRTTTKADLANA